MKKSIFIMLTAIFLALSIVVVICIFVIQVFLHGCLWWECVPERNFHVRDWELPSVLFPDGAIVGHIGASADGAGEIERGFQSIFWQYGGAGYSIKRFPSNRKAISNYEFEVNHMLDFKTNIPWEKPTQLTFHSSTADDVYIACGIGVQGKVCGFTGRYQEYVIYFSSSIGEGMTFEEFEEIVRYIDEQISSRLYP
jgi:hypothetical protein